MLPSQTKGNVINMRTQGRGKQTKSSCCSSPRVCTPHAEEFYNLKKGRNAILFLKVFYKSHFALSHFLPFYCFILQKKHYAGFVT